jgi:GntR family transcriptional regulator of arabinose operon
MPPKYMQIAAQLRAEIRKGAYRETGKLPTENELAEACGANRQTVRRALSLLTEEGLIDRRQGSGSYLRSAASRRGSTVAILTTSINDYIFPAILQDAQGVFEKSGYSTMLFCTHNQVNQEREILKKILSGTVCGLLVEGTKTALPNPNLDLYRKLEQLGVPIVFLHGCYAALPTSVCISDDNFRGGYLLTEYLLRKGHTKIAGIFKSDDIQGHERYAGFLTAFRDAGLPLPDTQIAWFTTEEKGRLLKSGGPSAMADFFSPVLEGCDAVVCYNDEIAFALIGFLRERGVRVPEDVAVVSFDNSSYSEFCSVRITSLAHGSKHIGRIAAESLLRLLRGEHVASQSVPWTLMEKESG